MTWTHIKHLLLGALITLSLYLSISLLTEGGQSTEQSNTTNDSTQVALVDRSLAEVFSPDQIILHEAYVGHQLASLQDTTDLVKKSYNMMKFSGVQAPETLSREAYQQAVHEDSWIEFMFDGTIPFGLFEGGLENVPSDYENRTFDRVLFNLNDENKVLFYNSQEERVYEFEEVMVPEDLLTSLSDTEAIEYTEAVGLELEKIVYVPDKTMSLPYKNYLVERLPDRLFISQFFTDTSQVDVRSTESTQRFIDYTTEVVINDLNHTLSYLSQKSDNEELSLTRRLDNSFQQLIKVENWKGQVHYQFYNPSTNEVIFQRYLDGMPVFSAQELESTVSLTVDGSGLRYLRVPLRIAQTTISLDEYGEKDLSSGSEIANRLEAAGVDFSTINGLKVGLTWKESEEEERVIQFEPDWYINAEDDTNWYTVDRFIELQGEAINGL